MTERESPFYELIDLASGNVASDFGDVDVALDAIRSAAAAQGWDSIQRYSLIRVNGDDQELVAMQGELVELARTQPTAPTPSTRDRYAPTGT